MTERRALLAFSGGTDSTAAAVLLREAGYEVTAFALGMTDDPDFEPKVRLRAQRLGLPLLFRPIAERFRHEVIEYFVEDYRRGRTPVPCTVCNSRIKWPELLTEADRQGVPFLATGHYFRITEHNGKYYVTRARDERKDQSYYLWDIPQEILRRTLTPMGERIKRELAPEHRDVRESMGLCFLGRAKCSEFLRMRMPELRPGPVVDPSGRTIGRHEGAALYTLGQRKGLGLPEGWSVVAVDTAHNRLVAGPDRLLWHRILEIGNCRAVDREEVLDAGDVRVVVRGVGRNPEGPARITPTAAGLRIELTSPAWAPAVGQSVVLYRDDRVVAGGFLERTE